MTTPTLKGFAAFVREQDADRRIVHLNFCSCAVGEYMQQVFGEDDSYSDEKNDRNEAFADNLPIGGFLYRGGGVIYDTYGQLQTALGEAGL